MSRIAKEVVLPKAEDRRRVHTRVSLQNALISLSLEKGYDATTVGDICAKAQVGRSTFYAHFTCKDDLKRSGLEDLRHRLFGHAEAAPSAHRTGAFAFGLPLFQHAKAHRDLTRALAGSHGGTIGASMIRQMVTDLVRGELSGPADAGSREATAQLLVGAFMGLLTWWLERGGKMPPEVANGLFRRLARKALAR